MLPRIVIAMLLMSVSVAKALDPQFQHLVKKAYTLQEQEMDTVNWMYIGYAPRIQDPKRIKIVLSKQGFTLRVNFQMTPEEVADYPAYLKRRADAVLNVLTKKKNVSIKQVDRLTEYLNQVDAVSTMGEVSGNTFEEGYASLYGAFPENITQFKGPDGRTWVEGNFVYPITVHKTGKVAYTGADGRKIFVTPPMTKVSPEAKTYFTETLEERRSAHWAYEEFDGGYQERSHIQDHLFNGFPAFWFKTGPGTKGAGIHGPIRYSSIYENKGLVTNDYLNDPQLWQDISPTYRFEVIRTANSEGCVRAEPMEMRHILPSNASLAKQVPIYIINDIDRVNGRYVDVNYYVENHYGKQDRRDWYLKHYITFEERQKAEASGVSVESILDERLKSVKVFPYLHPRVLELEVLTNEYGGSTRVSDAELMRDLNRAPLK